MPDDLTNENPPEIFPPENPPAHEPDPTGNADPENSLAQKIRRAGAAVFERAGITYKRGRGRPRKDGSPAAADVPLGAGAAVANPPDPSGPAPSGPAPAPSLPAVDAGAADALFRRSCVHILRGALDAAKGLIRTKSRRAGLDENFTERTLRECATDEPKILEDFSQSLELVCKKYAVSTEYAPEFALLASAGRLTAPYWLVLKSFNDEIARKRKLENSGGGK